MTSITTSTDILEALETIIRHAFAMQLEVEVILIRT